MDFHGLELDSADGKNLLDFVTDYFLAGNTIIIITTGDPERESDSDSDSSDSDFCKYKACVQMHKNSQRYCVVLRH